MRLNKYLYIFWVIFILSCQQAFCQVHRNQFFLYEDSSKHLTGSSAIQLFKNGKFNSISADELNLGFTQSVYWLAYKNPLNRPPDSLLLLIGQSHINQIHFFFANDSSITLQWLTGDYYPFSQRPFKATGFYFPITTQGIYLARIEKTNESLQLFYKLTSKINAVTEEADHKIVYAIFSGMILLLLIFGVYLFVISGSRLYIWYILYIGTGWLWVLTNAGYGFQYLWPNLPWFASKAKAIFVIAPLIFSILFLIKFIGKIQNKKKLLLVKTMNIFLIACIILILLFKEKDYQSNWWLYIQYFIPSIALVYILMTFIILITASIRGNKQAIFYLVAVIILIFFAIIEVSFSLGSPNKLGEFFKYYGMSIGYVTEAIILTAGIVYKFNQYRIDKELLLEDINKQQVANTRILMEAQQVERSQIANQLHDVAGSLLSAAKLNLSSLSEKKGLWSDANNNKLVKATEAIDLVANMVRNLSHALSPIMLEQVGFKTTIEKIIAIFNASDKINIRLLVIGFEKHQTYLVNYYTALYSIVYELMNNVFKHSKAKNALLQLAQHDDCFTLIMEDDGEGITPTETRSIKSLGMAGIQSKINYLGGAISLDQNKPHGLIITIEIPINNEEI